MSRYTVAVLTVLALAGSATRAEATVVFSDTSSGLAASASFTLSGSQLIVLLTNTDTAAGAGVPKNASQVLTGLFFNLGSSTFTPLSAAGYHRDEAMDPSLVQAGSIISTASCDIRNCSGQSDAGGEHFDGSDYENPLAFNGIEFGLVPNSWVAYRGNSGLDSNALIEGTVQFVLNLGTTGLSETDIRGVYFTYGTFANRTGGGTTSGAPTTTGGTGIVLTIALLSILGIAVAVAAYSMRRPDYDR